MDILPTIIVKSDFNMANVSFQPDIPNVVKFHLKCKLHDKFVCEMMNKDTLERIKALIAFELKYLYATGQFYRMADQWYFSQWKDETSFSYNALNFQ